MSLYGGTHNYYWMDRAKWLEKLLTKYIRHVRYQAGEVFMEEEWLSKSNISPEEAKELHRLFMQTLTQERP